MGNFRSIRAEANDNSIDLWLMSEINSWTAQDFVMMTDYYGNKKPYIINIYSPGGDPFAAFAIHDYIKAKGLDCTARVWGHAASAAAIIACSCKRVEMGEMSHLMIHNAYGGDDQALLDSINEKQVALFKKRTGMSANAIIKLMEAETWMDAKAAKENGFADSIIKELAIAALFKAQYMEEQKKPEGEKPEVVTPPETPETPETPTPDAAEQVEQEVEVTPAEAIQAAIRGKMKVKVSVGKELRDQLASAIAEVKTIKAQSDEAISEAEGLKEKLAKAEADLKAQADAATAAKAEAEGLNAKFTAITAEVERLRKAPLANAEGEPLGGGGAQVPGSASQGEVDRKSGKRDAVRDYANSAIDKATQRGNAAARKA